MTVVVDWDIKPLVDWDINLKPTKQNQLKSNVLTTGSLSRHKASLSGIEYKLKAIGNILRHCADNQVESDRKEQRKWLITYRQPELLTLCILMDSSFLFDTINLGIPLYISRGCRL